VIGAVPPALGSARPTDGRSISSCRCCGAPAPGGYEGTLAWPRRRRWLPVAAAAPVLPRAEGRAAAPAGCADGNGDGDGDGDGDGGEAMEGDGEHHLINATAVTNPVVARRLRIAPQGDRTGWPGFGGNGSARCQPTRSRLSLEARWAHCARAPWGWALARNRARARVARGRGGQQPARLRLPC
jgi:hypothetical protein